MSKPIRFFRYIDISKLLFLLIVLGAFLLRIYKIKQNPPALNWDEVSHGYNAYSILKTGKDEWGMRFPLIFRCFGDYKLPLYIYLTTLPVAIFGLNPVSVRLISVLSGVGLVAVSWLFGGWLAAFLAAVSPWSLFLSRVAVEANLAAFLVALGGWLVVKRRWGWAALLWGLALHAYNSARLVVPLLALFGIWQLLKEKNKKTLAKFVAILLVFFIPLIHQFSTRQGSARFYWVNLIDQGTVNRIIEARQQSRLPPVLTRLIYNRPSYFIVYSAKNYLAHFSPTFLFLRGGSHYQFSQPGFGLLYLVTLPFLLVGLWTGKNRFLRFWFFAAFFPSAITRDSPHVLRSILSLPLPMVFAAWGVEKVRKWLKNRSWFGGWLVVGIFLVGALINFVKWWESYWKIYRIHYSWAWQYGYKQAVEYVKQHYGEYDKIVFTKRYGEPHEFVLFWWPWEPAYYQKDPKKVWDYHAHWFWVDAFDKFEFWNDWEVKEKLKLKMKSGKEVKSEKLKILLITSPGNWVEGGRLLKTIYFLDGDPAFEIVEYQ